MKIIEVMAEKSKTHRSDKELLVEFRNGSRNAFDTLYNRYKDRLYTLVLNQVGDNNTADDIFQDVMIKAHKHLHKFDPEGNLGAWLAKIAINRIRDQQRKKNRLKKIFMIDTKQNLNNENEDYFSGIESHQNIELEFSGRESSAIINMAIKELPLKQREVVNLHYLMGLTFREIAEITNCSINTISARARYALNNIEKILGPQLVEELK